MSERPECDGSAEGDGAGRDTLEPVGPSALSSRGVGGFLFRRHENATETGSALVSWKQDSAKSAFSASSRLINVSQAGMPTTP